VDVQTQFTWLLFRFSGRLGRVAYLLSFLLIGLVQAFPFYRFMIAPEGSPSAATWSLIFIVALAASLYCYVAITVKRLHDLGRNGIEAAWIFVPVISIVVFIALCVVPGQPEANRFGRETDTDG